MQTENNKWLQDDLQKIDKADDLKISPLREDGTTHGTPTWIWAVVVNNDLYVRAYHGQNSRWYKSAIKQKAGRIHAAGMVKDVRFEKVQGNISTQIDEAYKNKYKGSPYLSHMISDASIAATIKIIPKEI